MADSRIGVGFGGEGGAGGLTLGPPTNEFSGANRAGAETARDTYGSANASWLAQYDAEPTYTIIISWPTGTPTHTLYQSRRSGSWADVTGLIRGEKGAKGDMGEDGTDGTVADGLAVDAVVFWSPTAQHDEADRVRFGDTVTIGYGGTEVEADVYNVARDGHIITMILSPLPTATWTAIDAVANSTVSDSDGNQFGSWVTASRVNDRANVQSAGQWFRSLAEAGAGSEVWREIDRIDEVDNTHLTVGTRTATTLELRSSTGDDVLLPSATPSEAGIESAADKELLEALPPKWTVGAYGIGTERSWAQKIYRCIVARTVADTDNPAADTTGWALGVSSSHRGTTNLSVGNRTGSSLDVQSDTGTDATLPSASRTEAGLQSAADKTKLDGVATGAQVNVQADWNESQSTAGSYIDNKPTIPDVSNFRTQTQITAEIAAALAGDGKVIDGGEWDATDAYAAKTLVYTTGAGAASYLSKIAVAANTQSTTEPGVGSDWRTSWVRVGYQDGPPNAFIDAAFTGRHLTLSREGGTNPQTLEVPIGTGQLVVEQLGTAGYDVTAALQYTAENSDDSPIDVSDVQDTDILAARAGVGLSAEADLIWFTGADIERNVSVGGSAAGPIIKISGTRLLRLGADSDGHLLVSETSTSNDPDPLTLWRVGGTNAPAGSTRVERITFQGAVGASSDFEASPIATDPISVPFGDGSPQIVTNLSGNDFDLPAGVQYIDIEGDVQGSNNNVSINFLLRDASNDSIIAYSTSPKVSQAGSHVSARILAPLRSATRVNLFVDRVNGNTTISDNWTADFVRFGGGVTGFNPGRIGTATFDLSGSAENVALMDDTTSAPIVCPAEGWVLAVITVPGLGLNGSVTWMLAEDLRAADADSALTASLYTNAQNQVFFGAGDQDGGATMGNKVILHHTGTITESSGGASAIVLPTILEFDVTGDSRVTGADISNKAYSWETRISQSAHVGSARIVGFMGTEANPSNVDNLDTITDYFHETGSFNLPANRTLASVGSIYTIREEVYPTGVADTTAPSIYHDFRVERVAPASHVHFGSMPFRRGDGTTPTDASDLTGFADDMSTAASAAGDWTIIDLVEADGERRLYWAVPTTLTQPVNWLNAGDNVNDIIDTPSAAQDIGGVLYRVYVTNTQFDDLAVGTTYTTRTS